MHDHALHCFTHSHGHAQWPFGFVDPSAMATLDCVLLRQISMMMSNGQVTGQEGHCAKIRRVGCTLQEMLVQNWTSCQPAFSLKPTSASSRWDVIDRYLSHCKKEVTEMCYAISYVSATSLSGAPMWATDLQFCDAEACLLRGCIYDQRFLLIMLLGKHGQNTMNEF